MGAFADEFELSNKLTTHSDGDRLVLRLLIEESDVYDIEAFGEKSGMGDLDRPLLDIFF